MKFWKVAVVGAVMAVAGTSVSAPQKPRLDAIWAAVHNRLTGQMDFWFEDGDYPRCIQMLRVLNEMDPSDYEAATDLGWMLENVESYDEALAVYIKFRKDNPKSPDAAFPEANFYYFRKAYSKVPPLIEPTLKSKPHGNSFRILAHSYERLGLLADSKRVWQNFIKLAPKDETARANLRRVEGKIKSQNVKNT
ncbi:MAG TPA: hypothetical protein VEX38_07705 [Fimbriimonadaceae bacterium]|nr:hypothetical protein [Fimbriimonadaceae bacterium]